MLAKALFFGVRYFKSFSPKMLHLISKPIYVRDYWMILIRQMRCIFFFLHSWHLSSTNMMPEKCNLINLTKWLSFKHVLYISNVQFRIIRLFSPIQPHNTTVRAKYIYFFFNLKWVQRDVLPWPSCNFICNISLHILDYIINKPDYTLRHFRLLVTWRPKEPWYWPILLGIFQSQHYED